MEIAIIDYGAGNIKSLQFALQRLGYQAILSADAAAIKSADKVIFPGVGQANNAMRKLKASGLDVVIPKLTQPVLGICLGMQLLCSSSEEGNTEGLGVFDVDVKRFKTSLKIPHVGWNTISGLQSTLFTNIPEKTFMYSVHSFYAPLVKETIALTNYGTQFSSALQKNNFYGVQFHPEKSSKLGEQLIKNFVELCE
ncbi:imidazole glycerol phosphate synthase subunit HisH [Patiriisocius hiemis]|uniref:Imidazole glycerol phosphate synthase subunit HisH n=1 Tax=Patiriisocius hiemis TaxID=3075604 RepID=A0ABU2Y9U1_9FLAO|nr:imidazole glycerol phosphate synthase subunit HisH [Constantimarinum sp. W242]MDT0554956.1 imidazole glycerol phosphate synthase subunit HisH [Constantimarinum sp. W242]